MAPAATCRCFLGAFQSNDLLKRLADVRAARRKALELHQLDDQVGSSGQSPLFEQRLLSPDIERGHLCNGIDQHLVIELADRSPVDRKPEGIAEPARLPFDIGPLDEVQRLRLIIVISGQVDIRLPV